MLARYLLRQPQLTGRFPDGSSVRLQVIKDTTVRTTTTRERVRMMGFVGGTAIMRPVIWLDRHNNLFASTQFRPNVTVRHDAQSLLPALRAVELAFRATEAADIAARLETPVPSHLAINARQLRAAAGNP